MIKHEYNNCASCHVDPSGAGLLTEYGRAQSVVLLSSTYGKNAEEDPGTFKDFLFGALPLPKDPEKGALNLGGFVRDAYYWQKAGDSPTNKRVLYMQADLDAHFQYKWFHAYGSIGYSPLVSQAYAAPANVTHTTGAPVPPDELTTPGQHFFPGNAVSRQHWVGIDLADQAVLIRAGRMTLPFGIRQPEHIFWVRQNTGTDYDQSQEHGISLAYNSEKFRGEVMGIAGNFQLSPDTYRHRGYSGYLEYVGVPHYAFGVSSLVTTAGSDILTRAPARVTRQAHGVFTRLSPLRPLSVLGELDVIASGVQGSTTNVGYAGMLQPDVEIVQGVHAIATGEVLKDTRQDAKTAYRAWLSGAWYIYSHFDVRLDMYRQMQSDQASQMVYLLQGHIYL